LAFGGSDASHFFAFGGYLYFQGNDVTHGAELWRTNGTTTELVEDINTADSGAGSSYPYGFTALGDWLYFRADDGLVGSELWRTNGTSTNRVADINSGVDSSYPRHFTTFGDYLHFTANDGTDIGKTWRVNAAGVVESLVLPGTNAYIDCMCDNAYTALGGRLFAAFSSNETGNELAYFDDPNVGLPETSRDGSAWSVPLALLAALTAVAGVGIRLRRKRLTSN
jgi:ELWxxDGT repeat protein